MINRKHSISQQLFDFHTYPEYIDKPEQLISDEQDRILQLKHNGPKGVQVHSVKSRIVEECSGYVLESDIMYSEF